MPSPAFGFFFLQIASGLTYSFPPLFLNRSFDPFARPIFNSGVPLIPQGRDLFPSFFVREFSLIRVSHSGRWVVASLLAFCLPFSIVFSQRRFKVGLRTSVLVFPLHPTQHLLRSLSEMVRYHTNIHLIEHLCYLLPTSS